MTPKVLIHNGPLVIGAGLAGLSVALNTAPFKTLVLSPVSLGLACSSAWAQGGIAAALSPQDTPQDHAKDTIAAGAGLVDIEAANALSNMGAQTVKHLSDMGAPFDHHKDGSFVLNREAAHGLARVARVGGDLAGKAILQAVVAKARLAPHIEIWEDATALGLITSASGAVIGCVVRLDDKIIHVFAPVTIMATGGLGGLYAVTTNPASLRGAGLAMAARAGAIIADPEFVQFHPTALNIGMDPAPLATEALRGDGAILVTKDGYRFALDDHKDAELAPRDIVARSVHRANTTLGGAYLDATKAIGAHFPDAFPTVFASAMKAGIDPRTTPMPVAPAAHYHMGGIKVDLDGRSSLKGLYAVGECASNGVHGANRLASNSLLEAAGFGARVGKAAIVEITGDFQPDTANAQIPPPPFTMNEADFAKLRHAMSLYAGVIRDEVRLKKLLSLIDSLETTNQGANELANELIVARLIAQSALQRCESRGSHYRSDFPELAKVARRSFLSLKDLLL